MAIFRSKKMLIIVSDSCRLEIFRKSLVSSAYAAGETVPEAGSAGGEGDPSVGDFLFNEVVEKAFEHVLDDIEL